jgi:hypothetical protein
MIYSLYWNKCYNSKKFWISTIKNIKGHYKDWVYIRKGLEHGLKFKGIEKCNSFYHYIYTGYWLNKDFMTRCYFKKIANEKNISEENIIKENVIDEHISEEHISEEHISEVNASEEHISEELDSSYKMKYNQECEFRGLIAGIGNIFTKYKKYQMVITIGYDNNKFVNLHLNKKRDLSRFKQIIGKGYWIESKTPHIVVTKMTLL